MEVYKMKVNKNYSVDTNKQTNKNDLFYMRE